METRGGLINDRTDGMVIVRIDLVRTKNSLLIRMPEHSVTISVHLDDVRTVLDELPLLDP